MTGEGELHIHVPEELRFFLPTRHRDDTLGRPVWVRTGHDGTSTLGHTVQSLGIPLTEVGVLRVAGRKVPPSHLPRAGEEIEVSPVTRPQPLPHGTPAPPRFLLDVHLGALARHMRLVGLDSTYRNDAHDNILLADANSERRILLTKDRGLLCRRALWLGAYVRESRPQEQLLDVLSRFAPPLAPWSRCPVCNGPLVAVPKREIAHRLPHGTRRTYDTFTRCTACARLYWPGAHHARLERVVSAARRVRSQQDAVAETVEPRRAG